MVQHSPAIGKKSDGRVQTGFYGTKGNIKNFADLLVWELMKIGQKEDFAEMGGHLHDGLLDQFLEFAFFHRFAGGYIRRL